MTTCISGLTMEPLLDDLIKQGEACPYYKLLNMKIEEVKAGYARLTMDVEEKHLQLLRTVHGGAISSLADSAAAWATWPFKKGPFTVEMKINFLAPVVSGRLIAEARSVHKGHAISLSDVEVRDDKGRLVAKSLVTYYIRGTR